MGILMLLREPNVIKMLVPCTLIQRSLVHDGLDMADISEEPLDVIRMFLDVNPNKYVECHTPLMFDQGPVFLSSYRINIGPQIHVSRFFPLDLMEAVPQLANPMIAPSHGAEVEAGFVAPVGVTNWPGSSATLAAAEQLAVGCSDSFPDRVSRNCLCCSSLVAVNAASGEPMLGSSRELSSSFTCQAGDFRERLDLAAGGSSGLAFGVTRLDWAFGILHMTIV